MYLISNKSENICLANLDLLIQTKCLDVLEPFLF